MNKFKHTVLILLFLLPCISFSQTKDSLTALKDTTYWQKSFTGGINFNQAQFSNWSGGGVNSLSLSALINARALYQKEKWSWDNTADLQLGYVYQESIGTRKAADQIFINSVAGYKFAKKWDFFVSGTFSTFFAPGYLYAGKKSDPNKGGDSLVSNFMAPAQFTMAWGVAYKPNDWFSVRMSPFAPRFTFVLDDNVRNEVNGVKQKAYGVEPDKKVRAEWLAFQLQAVMDKKINENVRFKAGYLMYLDYENFGKIDHRLDANISMKITKYISVQGGIVLLYNEDFSTNVQLQQTLGIGFLYNVSTFQKK